MMSCEHRVYLAFLTRRERERESSTYCAWVSAPGVWYSKKEGKEDKKKERKKRLHRAGRKSKKNKRTREGGSQTRERDRERERDRNRDTEIQAYLFCCLVVLLHWHSHQTPFLLIKISILCLSSRPSSSSMLSFNFQSLHVYLCALQIEGFIFPATQPNEAVGIRAWGPAILVLLSSPVPSYVSVYLPIYLNNCSCCCGIIVHYNSPSPGAASL